MTVNGLKEKLLELAERYFTGAEVAWGQTKLVQPLPALVTLTAGAVQRPLQPISQVIDGVPCGYYPSRMMLTVNLYTRGAAVEVMEGMTVPQENTAVNDLLAFLNFVNSPVATEWCNEHDISIQVSGDVHDVSELIDGTTWRYRAMVEFEVDFTQIAVGPAGILAESSIKPGDTGDMTIDPEWDPTSSGGGSEELAGAEVGWFTSVEINKEETEA